MKRQAGGWLPWAAAMTTGLYVMVAAAPASAEPHRIALLVGISEYGVPRMFLEGPAYDVAALRDVLVQRWGFRGSDVHTLVDKQASRGRIMAELAALEQRSASGDEVLIYFSGHGTSAVDAIVARIGVALPHGSGAFVPQDFLHGKVQELIVGRTDMRPVLEALDRGGRKVWVISDSCYSGQQVRSLDSTLPVRMIPPTGGEALQAQQANMVRAQLAAAVPMEPYPYRNVMYLAAAAEGESARDISRQNLARYPSIDGQPHGALTDALLRVLTGVLPADADGDGMLSLNEVQNATADFMDSRTYGHTSQRLPSVAEDDAGLGNRPVLNVRGVVTAPQKSAAKPLRVQLDFQAQEIRAQVAGVPGVQLVGGRDADISIGANDKAIVFGSAAGDLLSKIPRGDTAGIRAQLRQLAWAHQLRGLGEQYRRGILPSQVEPAVFGGNFPIGSKIAFAVRPDRDATLVLLNIASDGKVSVLYPANAAEAHPLQGGAPHVIPGTEERLRIVVQEPEGMDMQFAFAFDVPPPGLDKLYGLNSADPDDPRLHAFERTLAGMAGKFTFAATPLRTLPALAQPAVKP